MFLREQDLSASPVPHSLGTFLAEQESTAPGRDRNQKFREEFVLQGIATSLRSSQ